MSEVLRARESFGSMETHSFHQTVGGEVSSFPYSANLLAREHEGSFQLRSPLFCSIRRKKLGSFVLHSIGRYSGCIRKNKLITNNNFFWSVFWGEETRSRWIALISELENKLNFCQGVYKKGGLNLPGHPCTASLAGRKWYCPGNCHSN